MKDLLYPRLQRNAPEGTPVLVIEDDGTITRCTTRSPPWKMGEGPWLVLLSGRTGGYALDRVVDASEGTAWCACGDSIEPGCEGECGNCVTNLRSDLERLRRQVRKVGA